MNGRRVDLSKEFDNLTPDEILRKVGINDLISSSASSTLTPSSSTQSFSSSNHSIYASNGLSSGQQATTRHLRDVEAIKKQM